MLVSDSDSDSDSDSYGNLGYINRVSILNQVAGVLDENLKLLV